MVPSFDSRLSRRDFLLGSGAAASGALLAACSGTTGGRASPGGPPRRGGTFTFYSPTGVNDTLDLHATEDPATYRFISPLCSKLVELKSGPNLLTTQDLVPDLARSWEVAEDGLTYTFHLRDDVYWHDIPPVNGRPFTSDDALATFDTIIKRPAEHAWMFARVADLRAVDDYTFVIKMKRPYAPFLGYMANAWNVILPREHVERKFDIENMTIGTGPFMLKTYSRDVQMVRVRHPKYFVKGRPYLDELDHVVIPEQNSAIAAFLSGRVNVAQIPSDQLRIIEDVPNMTMTDGGATPVTLHLQTQNKPFDDLRVRRAVALAINFEGLGKAIYPGHWRLSTAIPPGCGDLALSAAEIRKIRPYDPEQARSLLAAAGHPNGFSTTMLVQKLAPQDVDGAEYMIQDLKKVGIDVQLQVLDTATAVARRINGQFEMAKAVRSINPPDTYLSDYESTSRLNYARIKDQKLDAMIEKTREIFDHGELVKQYHEIARYMETGIAAAIYGIAYSSPSASRDTVHNYYPNQLITGKWWADVWVDG